MNISNLHVRLPSHLLFGYGAIDQLTAQLERMNVSRPLLVTDHTLRESALLDTVPECQATYSDVHGNPTLRDVEGGLELYRMKGCDAVVAFGGGSVIDAAKLIALSAAHDLDIRTPDITRVMNELPARELALLAVPTTAGSGSEVGRAALVMLTDPLRKALVVSQQLMPSVAIVDPDLTLSLPPQLTAATGMDALSHCIEELYCPKEHPLVDVFATEGIRLIAKYLHRAVLNGDDRDARAGMMLASLYGGIGFQKGLGAVHALSHPLASIGVHHGTANSILLPHVMEFNSTAAPRAHKAVTQLLDLDKRDFMSFAADCGLPTRLSEVGLTEDVVPSMVALAMLENGRKTNPRPLDEADATRIYLGAL